MLISRGSNSRASPMIHIQELVLDESIDNSLAHSVSYYSVAPTSPPYPGHVYSPDRAKSSGGYSLSRELRQRLEHFDDDISDTVSCIDSPSQDTSVINSLFRQCDDASVDKYMSELVDDSVAEGHGSANHCDSKLKLRKQRSTGMQSNLTVRYHNMGNWPAESKEPKAKLLLIQMSEQIIFRETVLQALRSALNVMDKKYWQYCVERIKVTEAGRTIKSETMISMINQLFEAQKHVAVLIAHARSLAIETIEKVRQLRHIHAKNMKASSVVSIFWMNENYLLKIKGDMEFLNSSPTMRLWLGFTARELVVPPHSNASAIINAPSNVHVVNPHDPKAHWLKTNKQVYQDWFKRHEAYIQASWNAGKSKVIFKSDRRFLGADDQRQRHSSVSSGAAAAGERQGRSSSAAHTPGWTPEQSRPHSPFCGSLTGAESGSKSAPCSKPGSRPVTSREHDTGIVAEVSKSTSLAGQTDPAGVNSPTQIQERQQDFSSIPLTLDTIVSGQDEDSEQKRQLIKRGESAPRFDSSRPITPLTPDSPQPLSPLRMESLYAASFSFSGSASGKAGGEAGEENPHIGFSDSVEGNDFLQRSSTEPEDGTAAGQELVPEGASQNERGALELSEKSVGIAIRGTLTQDAVNGSIDTGASTASATATAAAAVRILPPSGSVATSTSSHPGDDAKQGGGGGANEGMPGGALASGTVSGRVSGTHTPVAGKSAPASGTPSQGIITVNNSVDTVSNEIPEWQQLAQYAAHSWGLVDVEADVDDCNNAFQDFKRGFHDRQHGINDYYGDNKYEKNVDYINGFHAASQGYSDAIVGFHESIARSSSKESIKMYAQGKNVAPLFWKTVDHNPLVVEAATGFEECFPSIYLVPPMPPDLLSRSEKCAHLLRREYETELEIMKQRVRCEAHKEFITSQVTTDALESMVSDSYLQQRSQEDAAMLKLRQQGNTELLTGISVNHLSNSLSLDAGSLRSLVLPSASQVTATTAPPQAPSNASTSVPTNQRRKGGIVGDDDGDNVFLTNSFEEGGMGVQLEQSDDKLPGQLPEQSVLYPQMHVFGSYVDTKDFSFFRVEDSSKVRQRIEEKIYDARKVVEYIPGEIFPVIRPDKVGLREPSHDTVKWRSIHAAIIQRVARGFMGRRFVKKMKIALEFNRSTEKVRVLMVGFMWRFRQREKYWESRFEAFLMRKLAVKKFRASMTLVAFFRKIVRARRQMREDDERVRLVKEAQATGDDAAMRKLIVHTVMVPPTPVSRNVRRRHAQTLIDGGNPQSHSHSPKVSGSTPTSRSRAVTHKKGNEASDSQGEHAIPKQGTKHVTISDVKIESAPSTAASSKVPFVSKPTSAQTSAPSTPLPGTFEPLIDFFGAEASASGLLSLSRKLNPAERLRSLEAPGPYDESKRRLQLKNDALTLVARVNRGKIQNDTLHTCRLIPTQIVPNLSTANAKMKKFSTKEYAFMNMPSQAVPRSLIKSSSDVYLGPIPKRVSSRGSASTSQLPAIEVQEDVLFAPMQSAVPSPPDKSPPKHHHLQSQSVDFSLLGKGSSQQQQSSPLRRNSVAGTSANRWSPPSSAEDKKHRSRSIIPSALASFSVPEGQEAPMTAMSLSASFSVPSSAKNSLFGSPPLNTSSFNVASSAFLHNPGSNVIGIGNASAPFANPTRKSSFTGLNSVSSDSSAGGHIEPSLSKSRSSKAGGGGGINKSLSSDASSKLGNSLHVGEVRSLPGSAAHGGALMRYNSTGLTLRSKKQQEAHDKAEAERLQLRNTLLKYM